MGIKIFSSLTAYIKKEFTNSTKFVSLAKISYLKIRFIHWKSTSISVRHKDYNTMSLNYNVLYLNSLDCEQ